MAESSTIFSVCDAALERRLGDGRSSTESSTFVVSVPKLRLDSGAVAAILGPSGEGKTTMLLGLLGLGGVQCVAGEVVFLGADWPRSGTAEWRSLLADPVCLLLQDAAASLDPVATIEEQMKAVTRSESAAIVDALLRLGVDGPGALLKRYPHQISGGEARRVTLAISLLRRPRLVVADEPSAGLDSTRKADLVRCLKLLQEETGCALLISTHDHGFAKALDAVPYSLRNQTLSQGWPEAPDWPAVGRSDLADAEVILSVEALTLRHGNSVLLRDVHCAVRKGEIMAICGPSGAGKTSLCRALAGHLDRRSGFRLAGELNRPARRAATQMLYQNAFASLTPGLSLRAMLQEAHAEGFDFEAEAKAVGLDAACLERCASQMSGGEQRRAALLRALAVRPEVLILDEPTASLDRPAAVAVVEMLLRAQRERQLAILWITHDLDLAEAIADSVRLMEGGRLCS